MLKVMMAVVVVIPSAVRDEGNWGYVNLSKVKEKSGNGVYAGVLGGSP